MFQGFVLRLSPRISLLNGAIPLRVHNPPLLTPWQTDDRTQFPGLAELSQVKMGAVRPMNLEIHRPGNVRTVSQGFQSADLWELAIIQYCCAIE
jgi:hypothetical protein